jgi:hypothetical protein
MKKEELEVKYLVEHKTLEEIGREYGITRQAVYYFVKKYGLSVKDAENVRFKCDTCGKESTSTRKRFKRSIKHFCSMECYKGYLCNSEYTQSRTGQRHARIVVEKYLGRTLRFGEVVHHIDGDNTNNDIKNLLVFGSHSEHLTHHHKVRQVNNGQ